jgi:flagellar biosynthesis GTPase FlhF
MTNKNSASLVKKRSSRPSPKVSATEYSTGTVKTGNDGNKYIVTKTITGVKRWKLHLNRSKKPESITTEHTKRSARKSKKSARKSKKSKRSARKSKKSARKSKKSKRSARKSKRSARKSKRSARKSKKSERKSKKSARKSKRSARKSKKSARKSKRSRRVIPFTANGVYYSTKKEVDEYRSKKKKSFEKNSPKESAKKYSYGAIKKGQDGKKYKIVGTLNNFGNLTRKRWARVDKLRK